MTELDSSQREVAEVEPETRQIVLAGPGAGKSETVGALAANLVATHKLYPEEILVISFSRAAVSVVRRRTEHVVDEGQGVRVRTIDSLAASLVEELSDSPAPFKSYDDTVLQAIALMAAGDDVFGDIRHVIVDEVQDVVGVRAEFVLALLEALPDDAGFTLLGDPLQSLYDFQLTDDHPMTSQQFLDSVRRRRNVAQRDLRGEYRSRTTVAGEMSRLRKELEGLDPSRRRRRVETASADLSPLGELDEDAVETIASWRGRTVLLCDTNARAALAASALARHGVRAEAVAEARDVSHPAWIALALADHQHTRIERSEFMAVAEGAGCPDVDEAWRQMRTVAGAGSGVDIRTFARQLAGLRGRDMFRRVPESPIVVSTVHRAKGLEFDNVVLVDSDDWSNDLGDAERMASMLYVAMSRGRDRVTKVDGIDVGRWRRAAYGDGERPWVKRPFRARGLLGVLMEPRMARAFGATGSGVTETLGAIVTWEETEPLIDEAGNEFPSWVASVDDEPIARTGEHFGRFMARECARGVIPRLNGGRVDGFETALGEPRSEQPGRHGLWVAARISGSVDLEWS
ncbi:UvrD-like helicase family protein [Yimella lutea]|uniref:UvrD-like helicase family protein n=1 Tax=Yimella lutea TaxID=587872 RepID=A0A542ECS5_9MICO|nr:ATP-dependent helicase [Yimella lutea]TQJ13076.1 UvrD-like helicase family protein [Yimella lutea]